VAILDGRLPVTDRPIHRTPAAPGVIFDLT
jgi:hypothetical protein